MKHRKNESINSNLSFLSKGVVSVVVSVDSVVERLFLSLPLRYGVLNVVFTIESALVDWFVSMLSVVSFP